MEQINDKVIGKLFNDIIRDKSIFFRGVKIGTNIKEVEETEGANFKKKIGANSHYKYQYEVGIVEDIIVYYGFDKETGQVDYVNLFFESFPKFYWSEDGGENAFDFIGLVEANDLEKYLTLFNGVYSKVNNHFIELLGAPTKIETKDNVFNKSYHNFTRKSWVIDGFRLFLTSYLNDKERFDTASQLMTIKLSRE